MVRSKKNEWRDDARNIAIYGYPPGFEYSYDAHVGLTLNTYRCEMRQAYLAALGVGAAGSTRELDFDWFDSFTETEGEALDLMVKVNLDRETREILAKHGR